MAQEALVAINVFYDIRSSNVNFYIRKFIIENYKEDNSGTFNLLLTFCIKKYNTDKRISELIINDLNRLFNSYFNKGLDIPFDSIRESIESFKNSDATQLKQENRFTSEYVKFIQISNFKGFYSVIENDSGIRINLHNKKNIFYGANGSGKTSFCEALEYKLTGNIKEAKRRGIKEKEYFGRKDKGTEKIEIGFKSEHLNLNKLTEFEASEFNKCFIEKNRISEFALLRGHKETGVRPTDVTARLLGFEIFDEFKSKFVQYPSFKNRAEKIKVYDSYNRLKNLNSKNEIRKEDYCGINTEINRLNIDVREIERLEFSLWSLRNVKDKLKRYGLTEYKILDVKKWFWRLYLNIRRLEKLNLQLAEQSTELDFKHLYQAVINIGENLDKSVCPACKTSVELTKVNPFENSKNELKKLANLTKIQSSKEKIIEILSNEFWSEFTRYILDYKTIKNINSSLQNDEFDNLVHEISAVSNFNDKLVVLRSLFENPDTGLIEYLDKYSVEYGKNSRIDNIILRIDRLIEDRQNKLTPYKEEKVRFKHLKERQKSLYKSISEFKKSSIELLKKTKQEKQFAMFIDDLIESYGCFLDKLELYLLKEQSELISKIKGSILGYYNEINKGDSDDEIIQEIEFNQQIDKTYSVDLKRSDGVKKAGIILSEGHLRSLGLSIILSIAEASNAPFIVFDDVVNAIDSEHRANIIDMMFNNVYLKNTQLIVTTHDRLFWERFCNIYSSRINKKDLSSISFCFRYQNQGILFIPYQISFEDKIKEALSFSDIRQALVYLRIWFETICFNYCKRTRTTITGQFSADNAEKPTHLIVSLTEVYNRVITPSFSSSNNLKVVKEKLNWKFLNQEHHSFDENIFNVTHSTTSSEIEDIFQAVKNFEQEVNERSHKYQKSGSIG